MAKNDNIRAFEISICTALDKLHNAPDSDALALYWENRLFDGAKFKESEANQHTLEEILDDVIFALE